MERKPYSPPTVTDHGNVVEKTKGWGGDWWEYWGSANCPPLPPPGKTNNLGDD
jgi:hypothetical protein